MFNEIPGWIVPVISSIFTGLAALFGTVLKYKHQQKKNVIEHDETIIRLKEVDLAEIKAIAEGNKALREALIERVDSYERTFNVLRSAHQDCERRLAETEDELRSLKRRVKNLEDRSRDYSEPKEDIGD